MIYGNSFLPEEYLVEFTGANRQYINLLKKMKRDFSLEKKKFNNCIKDFDKKGALKSLDELEKICEEAEKVDLTIEPDKSDMIFSMAASLIQAGLVGGAIGFGGAVIGMPSALINFAAIMAGFTGGSQVSPSLYNSKTAVKDPNKKWNAFRNVWANYFKTYKDWIKEQRKLLKESE